MQIEHPWALAAFAAASLAAASPGAIFKPGAWYENLNKPPWTPPNWLFPIAWTVLFAMIAVAGYLVWERDGVGMPILLFLGHLVVNSAWSYFFFGRRRIDLALVDVVLLAVLVAALIWLFAPISPIAAWLLAPYLVWVSFAAVLNAEILRRARANAAPA